MESNLSGILCWFKIKTLVTIFLKLIRDDIMAEFFIVKEEEKIESFLPLNIRLGEKLENENILIFDENDLFIKEANKVFENCFDNISIDLRNNKHLIGNKEKQIPANINSFLNDSFQKVQFFIKKAFPFYGSSIKPFMSSFVPLFEKKSVNMPLLLHHFSFHPMNGDRILTICVNLDLKKSFNFITTKFDFDYIAKKMVGKHQFPLPSRENESLKKKLENKIRTLYKKIGFDFSPSSPYDAFMFRLYKFLEEKKDFHKENEIIKKEIKSYQSCLFFSDSIPHNIELGSAHLTFSFVLPRYSLLNPEKSPISILERMSKEVMKEAKVAYFKKN